MSRKKKKCFDFLFLNFTTIEKIQKMSSNITNNSFVPYVGESIFLNTSGAPFLIFVGLNAILIVCTLIAIAIMVHQHDRHMKKINAVRGFHQNDIEQGNEILKHLERENGGVSGGLDARRRSSVSNSIAMSSGSLQLNAMRRRSSVASGASSGQVNNNNGSRANSISTTARQHQHNLAHRPHRLIYDFHHTPPQPDLNVEDSGLRGGAGFDLGSPQGKGNNNNGGMPRLDLGALGREDTSLRMDMSGNQNGSNIFSGGGELSPAASNSSFAARSGNSVNRRGVGMESMRRR